MLKKFGVFALILLGFEVLARIYLLSSIPDDVRPPASSLIQQFFKGGSYVGEFRGKKVLFNKPENVFRILAIGGSTTAGIRGDQETWPFKLEQILIEEPGTKKIEVINLGQTGAVSAHELFYLQTHAYLQPDLVILYDGYNDLVVSNAQSAYYLASSQKAHDMLKQRFGAGKILSFLYRHSALANRVDVYMYRFKNKLNETILKKKMFGLGKQSRTRAFENLEWYASHNFIGPELEHMRTLSPEQLAKEMGKATVRFEGLEMSYSVLDITGQHKETDLFPEVYALNLRRMGEFLKQNKIPAVFVFQPFLSEKLNRLEGGLNAEQLRGMSNFTGSDDMHFVRHNESRKAIMREAANQSGVSFLDLQTIFDGMDHREVYLDNCHNNDKGLEVVARGIADYLRISGKI